MTEQVAVRGRIRCRPRQKRGVTDGHKERDHEGRGYCMSCGPHSGRGMNRVTNDNFGGDFVVGDGVTTVAVASF